jgi:uncharacterized membrane protein YjfL (UPF0719 family)
LPLADGNVFSDALPLAVGGVGGYIYIYFEYIYIYMYTPYMYIYIHTHTYAADTCTRGNIFGFVAIFQPFIAKG